MTAPNIVNVTSITGNTNVLAVTTSAANIAANPVASSKVLKINSLVIANIDGTNSADITAELVRNGTAYAIISTVAVPADATLVAISKDTSMYLQEGDYIRLTAGANGDLTAICSFEEIS